MPGFRFICPDFNGDLYATRSQLEELLKETRIDAVIASSFGAVSALDALLIDLPKVLINPCMDPAFELKHAGLFRDELWLDIMGDYVAEILSVRQHAPALIFIGESEDLLSQSYGEKVRDLWGVSPENTEIINLKGEGHRLSPQALEVVAGLSQKLFERS